MPRRLLLGLSLAILASGMVAGTSGDSATTDVPPFTEDGTAPPNGTYIVHAGDRLTLQNGPGQAVRGRTEVSPGTALTVRIRSVDDDRSYLRSVSTIVDSAGTFRAVVDLTEVPAGTALRVIVHRAGTNLTTATADVVDCTSDCGTKMPATPSAVVVDDGGRLSLTTGPGQSIEGRTNLPAGTTVLVRTRATEQGNPFIKQREAIVDGNGTFRAVFNFADFSTTRRFEVAVIYNGTTLTTARGVAECRRDCEHATQRPFADAELGVVQVDNGTTARIPVRLGEAREALLTIDSPNTNYSLAVTVTDANDDGEVVVLFDTASAMSGSASINTADQTDSVLVHAERGTFSVTDYRLALHPPGNRSVTVASGLLVVIQHGRAGEPLLSATPADSSSIPVGSAAALFVGAVLAVVGLGLFLGILDIGALVDRL